MFPRRSTDAGSHARVPSLLLAVLLVVGLAISAGSGVAQAGASAEGLTQSLIALSLRYQAAPAAAQAHMLGDLVAAAAQRHRRLASLVETDPGAVLRVALPASQRGNLPAAAQLYVEGEEQTDGDLEILYEELTTTSRLHFFLHTPAERLSLHFAADPPTHLLTGAKVRVRGVRVGQAMALDSGSTSVQALTTVLPNSFGAQKTLVILVNFQDKASQPYTIATAQSVMANTSRFFLENSFQQTWLTGAVDTDQAADVRGWYTVPLSSTVCDSSALATQARAAAQAAGVNLSLYRRYVYAFPNNACSWWGLGSVGGNPSNAWINGSFAVKVVGHEMGHNLGLYHSRSQSCDTAGCAVAEYGDIWDIMGNPSSGHFNPFQKERLGWLDYGALPPIAAVQQTGTYWLDPYVPLGANPKALKVLKSTDRSTGKRTFYYLEYRTKTGFDGSLTPGVIVRTGSESSGNSTYTWDLLQNTSSTDWLLDVGQSYTDEAAGVTLTTLSADASGASVFVSFGPTACVQVNPTLAIAPSATQWTRPGHPVSYTATVTNNDTSGCNAANFDLAAAAPAGWTAAFSKSPLSVGPGANASASLTLTSPLDAHGFQTVPVKATNQAAPAYTASASATQMVVTALDVAVSTDKAAYSRNQQVTIKAIVRVEGSPASNASVTFTVTKPNGAAVTGRVATDTTGTAAFKVRLNKKDPVGTYAVTATADLNGVSGTASTTFTAQ